MLSLPGDEVAQVALVLVLFLRWAHTNWARVLSIRQSRPPAATRRLPITALLVMGR